MKNILQAISVIMALTLMSACDQPSKSPLVRIATNPWPGYELLFLAEKLGYFKEEKLNIKLLQLASLVDVQRTYNQGRANGMASTVIEAIIVASLNEEKLKIVLIPDYSYGGDMLIARKGYGSVADLKGKKIGVETGSLGIVILEKALSKYGLSISDVEYVNLEQLKMKEMLSSAQIDASVTYPPFATEMLRDENYKTLFTTKEIPNEIIDVISVREDVLLQDPKWVERFHRAWFKALDFLASNREEAISTMAEREGISAEEFEAALSDLYLLNKEEIKSILKDKSLVDNIKSICGILTSLKTIEESCDSITDSVTVAK